MQVAQLRRHLVAVMAKHLPPSRSLMRLLDLDGKSGPILAERRNDLEVKQICPSSLVAHPLEPDSIDAVVGIDVQLDTGCLQAVMGALRPGGRLIAIHSRGTVSESHPRLLRENGYVRILVEPALDEFGVLLRGEKAHTTADTQARIRSVAEQETNLLDLASFKGRYIHLLVQQRPNKPVWKLEDGDTMTWHATAISGEPKPIVLAFSSLPKAVAFMQPAVLAGVLHDINKVGKFSLSTARSWTWDLVLNPTIDHIRVQTLTTLEIDPASAEASDE